MHGARKSLPPARELPTRELPTRELGRRDVLRGALGALGAWFARAGVPAVSALAAGCGGGQTNTEAPLEAASDNTTLGPGDVFQMEIVGEPDLPKEYQVAADGTVTLPYIQLIEVAGLEPHEVASRVRQKLIEGEILMNPSVVVSVKEYRSKRVTVLGQVQQPGSFPITPGLTLIQALSLAGGLTSIANAGKVNLSRGKDGQTRTVVINVELIYEGKSEDILLQPGDRIFVHERVF